MITFDIKTYRQPWQCVSADTITSAMAEVGPSSLRFRILALVFYKNFISCRLGKRTNMLGYCMVTGTIAEVLWLNNKVLDETINHVNLQLLTHRAPKKSTGHIKNCNVVTFWPLYVEHGTYGRIGGAHRVLNSWLGEVWSGILGNDDISTVIKAFIRCDITNVALRHKKNSLLEAPPHRDGWFNRVWWHIGKQTHLPTIIGTPSCFRVDSSHSHGVLSAGPLCDESPITS